MCGLIGFTRKKDFDNDSVAESMCNAISRRGPDSQGIWSTDSDAIVLGHRRLAVVDLSPAGSQPMTSVCGRYVLAFNGEVYNHLKLREQLPNADSVLWRGHSDTETLLSCFVAWGIEATLQKAVGMFAIALWDREDKILTLARDRLGEKPLYWGWSGDLLVFASELKAIKTHPDFLPVIDRDSLTLLLRHSYIPAPYSIYKGIRKLMPGHLIHIPLRDDMEIAKSSRSKAFWAINDTIENSIAEGFSGDINDAIEILEHQLKASIADQMLSDVPLGAFLSGGVDSSTVVALMQAQSSAPIRTFTIGFDEDGYNEANHAKAIAQHLGTDHTEFYVRPEDALLVIPKLAEIYCEPFADSSQIPTFLVSQLAKEHVTVVLSGDGGDELFGGYNRYLAAQNIWQPIKKFPALGKNMGAYFLRILSPANWNKLFDIARPVLPKKLRLTIPGEKARKLADVLSLKDDQDFYLHLTSHWTDPESIVVDGVEPPTLITQKSLWPKTDCLVHTLMALDASTYLADDILVKVDRAAMACSLETRVPMLDHRVFELAWKMPINYKVHGGQGKWLLRQVLYRHVPKELIERPKMGFGIPLDSWLRGPLKAWAEALLDEKRLSQEGYFKPAPVRKLWHEHLSGKKNWQYHLWNVLMFQAWLEKNH